MNTHESSAAPPRPPFAERAFVWAGIVGVPVIWMLHLLVSTTLIGTACAGGVVQRNALPWPTVETVLRAVSALAFVVALVGTLLAWRAWRCAAHAAHAHAHTQSEAAVSGAERNDHGKHRFLALCGAMVSTSFTAGLVFTASVLIAASPAQLCEPFR